MHSKLVRNAAILLFLLVVVLSGVYIARAKTGAVSDTGTTVDNNGGHYVKYGAYTYYRQYNDACFEANGVYGDFDYVPGAKSVIMQIGRDGKPKKVFDDNGCGPLFICQGTDTRFVLNRLSKNKGRERNEIYSVTLDGRDLREYGHGRIFAVDDARAVIIAFVNTRFDGDTGGICVIDVATGKRTGLYDANLMPSYYDENNGILYCEELAEPGWGIPDICSIDIETGRKAVLCANLKEIVAGLDADTEDADWYTFKTIRPEKDCIYGYMGGYNMVSLAYHVGFLLKINKNGNGATVALSPAESDWWGLQKLYSPKSEGPFQTDKAGYYMWNFPKGEKPVNVLSADDLKRVGLPRGEYFSEADFATLQAVEYVDASVFFTVIGGPRYPMKDAGWQNGYARGKSSVYKKDLTTGEITLLYAYGSEPAANETSQTPEATDLPSVGELVEQAYYGLPADVMPDYLQTEAQRRSAEFMQNEAIAEYGIDFINSLSVTEYMDEGAYCLWKMAGYLADDGQHLLLIVQYGVGLDAFALESDKTLYYNLSTKTFTTIERPIELYTAEELLPDAAFDSKEAAAKARAYFAKHPKIFYREFTNDGFSIVADLFEYWNDHVPHAGFDFYEQSFPVCSYQWDGKRFVKAETIE